MMWWSLTVSAVCDKGREGLYGFRISTCRNFRSGYTSSIRITITHLNEVCYQSIFKFVNFYFSFSGGGILVNLVFFNWFLFFIVCLGFFFQTLTESFQLFYCNYIEKNPKIQDGIRWRFWSDWVIWSLPEENLRAADPPYSVYSNTDMFVPLHIICTWSQVNMTINRLFYTIHIY